MMRLKPAGMKKSISDEWMSYRGRKAWIWHRQRFAAAAGATTATAVRWKPTVPGRASGGCATTNCPPGRSCSAWIWPAGPKSSAPNLAPCDNDGLTCEVMFWFGKLDVELRVDDVCGKSHDKDGNVRGQRTRGGKISQMFLKEEKVCQDFEECSLL